MKLNKNSWHARFYKKSYVTEELPKTICNYFWSMFFAIVLLPITWWGYLLSDKIAEDWKGGRVLVPTIITSFILFVGCVTDNKYKIELTNFMLIDMFISGLVFVGISTILIIMTFMLLGVIVKKLVNIKSRKLKTNIFKEYFKNVKEKNCSIIDWKDDEKDI